MLKGSVIICFTIVKWGFGSPGCCGCVQRATIKAPTIPTAFAGVVVSRVPINVTINMTRRKKAMSRIGASHPVVRSLIFALINALRRWFQCRKRHHSLGSVQDNDHCFLGNAHTHLLYKEHFVHKICFNLVSRVNSSSTRIQRAYHRSELHLDSRRGGTCYRVFACAYRCLVVIDKIEVETMRTLPRLASSGRFSRAECEHILPRFESLVLMKHQPVQLVLAISGTLLYGRHLLRPVKNPIKYTAPWSSLPSKSSPVSNQFHIKFANNGGQHKK